MLTFEQTLEIATFVGGLVIHTENTHPPKTGTDKMKTVLVQALTRVYDACGQLPLDKSLDSFIKSQLIPTLAQIIVNYFNNNQWIKDETFEQLILDYWHTI